METTTEMVLFYYVLTMQCLKNVFPTSNDFFPNNSCPNPLKLTSRGLNLIQRVTKVKISTPSLVFGNCECAVNFTTHTTFMFNVFNAFYGE